MSDSNNIRIDEKITDHKFINIYKVIDTKHHVDGYMYAERLGKDSVAFICYDEDKGEVLVNKEYKPPVNEFIVGAFGGSLDKDVPLEQIVREEAREEAGFEKVGNVYNLGKVLVSTQMNQFCHLFLVMVDKNDQGEKYPENEVEAMSETIWIKETEVLELDDWKSIAIAAKSGLRAFLDF